MIQTMMIGISHLISLSKCFVVFDYFLTGFVHVGYSNLLKYCKIFQMLAVFVLLLLQGTSQGNLQRFQIVQG